MSMPRMKPGVANSIGDERFVRRIRMRLTLVVEADQQERTDAHQLPTDEDLKEIVGQHQVEHGEAKERQKHEETAESAAPVQMAVLGMHLVIFDDRA